LARAATLRDLGGGAACSTHDSRGKRNIGAFPVVPVGLEQLQHVAPLAHESGWRIKMRKPISHRGGDPRQTAEAAFKAATTKPVEAAAQPKPRALPAAKELVPLRIDRDVLEHFQNEGPGWQERINLALRQAAGLEGTAEK
jgi:uncharacterized protein (DUF4415 family)